MPRQHVRAVRLMSDTVVSLRPPVPVGSVQGTLALDIAPRVTPPAFEVADHAPSIGADVLDDGRGVDDDLRRAMETWVGRFAQAAVEIVGGDRPLCQLVRWTSGEVYADLRRRAHLVAQAGGHTPGVGRVQPVRPKVVSVHAAFVAPEVVETSIRTRYGDRSRALAARFEQRRGRWMCVALEWA